METTDPNEVRLTDDAHVIYIAPILLVAPLQSVMASTSNRNAWKEEILSHLKRWQQGDTDDEIAAISTGEAVLVEDSPLDDVLARYKVTSDARNGLQQQLAEAVNGAASDAMPPPRIELNSVMARLCSNGVLSLAVHLVVPGGWDKSADSFRAYFAGDARERNIIGKAICDLLATGSTGSGQVTVVRELAQAVRAVAAKHHLGLPSSSGEDSLHLPYYHVIYAGRSSIENPGSAALAADFRQWIYPPSPQPVTSNSPYLDEFVYVGYAFSIIAAHDALPPRLGNLVALAQIAQAQYHLLETRCAQFQSQFADGKRSRLSDLNNLEEYLRIGYRQMATPTFTFNHHILCLRNGLIRQWRIDQLLERAEHLVRTIRSREEARRDRLFTWLKGILVLITILAVIQTIDSLVNLADRWATEDRPTTAHTEAEPEAPMSRSSQTDE